MAIDALKEQTEIVFISGRNLHKTPEVVQQAMASKEAFGATPIIAVFDPSVEERIGVVPYRYMKDPTAFDEVKAGLALMRGVEPEPAKLYPRESWEDVRGRKIQATYVSSDETTVTLRLSNGKLSTLDLSRLSDVSKARVAELAGE